VEKVNPILKPLFDQIAKDELTPAAKAGEKLRYRMLLAILYKRAGFAKDAERWAKEAREPLPAGWEKELNWIERVQLSSARATFDRVFPPPTRKPGGSTPKKLPR